MHWNSIKLGSQGFVIIISSLFLFPFSALTLHPSYEYDRIEILYQSLGAMVHIIYDPLKIQLQR